VTANFMARAALLQTLISDQAVKKKINHFYGARPFVIMFTTLNYDEPRESSLYLNILFP